MAGDRDTLLSMGFDPARVDWALRATSNRGLQPAMDHILEHESEPVPDPTQPQTQASASAAGASSAQPMDVDDDDDDVEALRALAVKSGSNASAAAAVVDVEAKSIKCTECGKIFKNTALANYHAEKSGHDQFEESTEEVKPLTEEEKKQKLEELRERMAEKRSKKAVEQAKEQAANDLIRRKAGKDLNKIKEDLKVKEAVKEAEQRRRDKIEDAKARAAIKAQIEADKRERAAKAAREKALREGRPIVDDPSTSAPSASAAINPGAATTSGVAGKDFPQTRLQIRMTSASAGGPYTTTLPSDSLLREVAEFLAGQTLEVDVGTVSLTQQFPRKTFSQADFGRTLRELGLTPSAVLIAS